MAVLCRIWETVVRPASAASVVRMTCTGAAVFSASCLMREPDTTTCCGWSFGADAAAAGAAVCEKAGAAAAAHAAAISERRNRRARVEFCAFMEVLGREIGIVLGTLTTTFPYAN